MDRTQKGTIAVILSAIILSASVYGSYMPMRKAQLFIASLQSLQSSPVSSLSELENRLSLPLEYPSPIGQEELVRNTANNILSFVQQSSDASSTKELVSFLIGYYAPVISRGKGMSFGQDLYLMGAINEMAYARTGDKGLLDASLQYYSEAETLGPNRPQALYGLFDVYRFENDAENVTRVGNKILANWPTDTNVAQSMQAFLMTESLKASSSAATSSAK